jgi:hypothetical protein
MADWDNKPKFSFGPSRKWYWPSWMILGFVIAIAALWKSWKYVNKRALFVCVLLSFFLMQMLEGFATLKGLWIWNDQIDFFKIGNIPVSEWGVYICSPMVAVGIIEYVRMMLMKLYKKEESKENT